MADGVKIMVTGNAIVHGFAYERGIHLVSNEIAKKLTDLGVAKKLDEVRTADVKVEDPKASAPIKTNKRK